MPRRCGGESEEGTGLRRRARRVHRPHDVRADGGPGAPAHLRKRDGPETHHSPPALNTKRPIQQAATHRGNAQARYRLEREDPAMERVQEQGQQRGK